MGRSLPERALIVKCQKMRVLRLEFWIHQRDALPGNTNSGITSLVKVTSKGQVTIPMPIRNEFGLKPGREVEFVVQAGKVFVRAKQKSGNPVEDWLKEAIGVARGKTTTAKVMKATRGEG